MADKPVTVAVPEERVPEFYAWFAHFLAAPAGAAPSDPPAWGGDDGGTDYRVEGAAAELFVAARAA